PFRTILRCYSGTTGNCTRLLKPMDLSASNRSGGSSKANIATITALKMKKAIAIGSSASGTITTKLTNGFCMVFLLRPHPQPFSKGEGLLSPSLPEKDLGEAQY